MLLLLLLAATATSPSRRHGRGSQAVSEPRPRRGGLDLTPSCVGDGKTDCTECLQEAINVATCHNRPAPCTAQTLLLPAGIYTVSSQLNAPHDPPLRLMGDGYAESVISASRPMAAVLNFTCLSGPGVAPAGGAATPIPIEGAYIGDLTISANKLANYSIFAPGMARSRFNRVKVDGALIVGVSLGFGWCNYIEGCRFGGNGIGLHTYNSANNIDVIDCIFEANYRAGFYMSGGYQILAQGNTLESNGIAIVVEAVEGVEISSNYFEANPDKTLASGEVVTLQPNSETSTAPPIAMHSDILLNGASSFHDGSSFFPRAQNPGWEYGRGYCPGSVTIRGNTHSPAANTSLIYAVCGSDIVIEGNSGDSAHKTRAGYHLLETGSDPELYLIKHLSVKGNVGFPSLFKLHDSTSLRHQIRTRMALLVFTRGWSKAHGRATGAAIYYNLHLVSQRGLI
jgi:parallel beta-helix repeat protein